MTLETTRDCLSCKGVGEREHWRRDGSMEQCPECGGTGKFSAPDFKAILKKVVSSRGKSKGQLKKSWAGSKHYEDRFEAQAYYVWRLARFHGGQDVRLPMTAEMIVRGNPYRKELEAFSALVAQHAFGTDKAARYRWASAIGHDVDVPKGLPATAYPCGPERLG